MKASVFVRKVPTSYRVFQVAYLALALNFLIPAASYALRPAIALATLDRLNQALGGGPIVEAGDVWHMLAVGNVMTLGVMCAMILLDLRRFYAVVPALAFLKGFSATYSLVLAPTRHVPVFYAVFLLDGLSTLVMIATATRAKRDLDRAEGVAVVDVPWWAWLVFPNARRVVENLEKVRASRLVARAPNLWQLFLGTLYMAKRVVFRSSTVGTCSDPVRSTTRARLLAWRALRLPFLLAERVVAPLDLSGLASDRDRVLGHLLGAHHDGAQFVYDLELLAVHPGALEELRDATRALIDEGGPRAAWLRDLCVFEGYHEKLLAATEAALAGTLALDERDARSPDITFKAWLAWCADRPEAPGLALRAWVRGELSFAPPPA